MCYQIVNQNVFHHLLLNKKSLKNFSYKAPYLDIFWIVVGGGGHILAVGGWCWMVEDIFWLVVDGGGYILAGGGWWCMVVGGCGCLWMVA